MEHTQWHAQNKISYDNMDKLYFLLHNAEKMKKIWQTLPSQDKFICIAHFMKKTIQSALHKIKALQRVWKKH